MQSAFLFIEPSVVVQLGETGNTVARWQVADGKPALPAVGQGYDPLPAPTRQAQKKPLRAHGLFEAISNGQRQWLRARRRNYRPVATGACHSGTGAFAGRCCRRGQTRRLGGHAQHAVPLRNDRTYGIHGGASRSQHRPRGTQCRVRDAEGRAVAPAQHGRRHGTDRMGFFGAALVGDGVGKGDLHGQPPRPGHPRGGSRYARHRPNHESRPR